MTKVGLNDVYKLTESITLLLALGTPIILDGVKLTSQKQRHVSIDVV